MPEQDKASQRRGTESGDRRIQTQVRRFPIAVESDRSIRRRRARHGASRARDALDDATDLKRLLKGAGVLEYHILAARTCRRKGDLRDEVCRAASHADGPRVHAGDEARWYEVDQRADPTRCIRLTTRRNMCSATSRPTPDGKPRSLDNHTDKPWHLTDATRQCGNDGRARRRVQF